MPRFFFGTTGADGAITGIAAGTAVLLKRSVKRHPDRRPEPAGEGRDAPRKPLGGSAQAIDMRKVRSSMQNLFRYPSATRCTLWAAGICLTLRSAAPANPYPERVFRHSGVSSAAAAFSCLAPPFAS